MSKVCKVVSDTIAVCRFYGSDANSSDDQVSSSYIARRWVFFFCSQFIRNEEKSQKIDSCTPRLWAWTRWYHARTGVFHDWWLHCRWAWSMRPILPRWTISGDRYFFLRYGNASWHLTTAAGSVPLLHSSAYLHGIGHICLENSHSSHICLVLVDTVKIKFTFSLIHVLLKYYILNSPWFTPFCEDVSNALPSRSRYPAFGTLLPD